MKDANGKRGGAAEAVEADALAALDGGDAQAAEANDAGAEQRGGEDGIETVGERVGKISADGSELGVAAVDRVAGEDGMVAEVLHVVTAKPAVAVDAADPGDADAHADGRGCGCAFNDFADNLMAGDDARMEGRKVALDDVEIGAADAAGDDFEEDFARLRLGTGDFFDGKPGAGGGCGVEDGCAHGRAL